MIFALLLLAGLEAKSPYLKGAICFWSSRKSTGLVGEALLDQEWAAENEAT